MEKPILGFGKGFKEANIQAKSLEKYEQFLGFMYIGII